jgi:hypothetical protein
MPDMLAPPSAELRPSSGLENSAKALALPSGDLGAYLRQHVPEGAPALQLALWGFDGHYPLPLTAPHKPCPEWLHWELEHRLTFKRIPLKREDIDRLVELLTPGRPRPDWLPAYKPDAWPVEDRQTLTGRRCTLVRYIAAAVACDLGAHPTSEVSEKVLNLHDHETRGKGEPAKVVEYRRHGRRLLSLLGVWPWTHAESGKLLKRWRMDPAFLVPFQVWHKRTWEEYRPVQDERECQRAIIKAALAGAPDLAPEQIAQQEEGERALIAIEAGQAKLLAAREQARRARRPVS